MDIFRASLIATSKKIEGRKLREALQDSSPMLQAYTEKPLFHSIRLENTGLDE